MIPQPLTTHTFPVPSFFPDQVRETLTGREVSVRMPKVIRRNIMRPEKVSISEWTAKHRMVTEIDVHPGPWRQELVPHTKKIMDIIGQPWVRQVWMCMTERGAKTQILQNTALSSLDQGYQSGNIFWLMPTEKDARDALGERIIPALKACRRTRRLLSKKTDDTSRGMIRFTNGVRLRPAWSNSPSSIASYFGRLNIADECDKFAERTSEGTDPIKLFKKRSRDDKEGSKYLFASTPAGRYIYKGMKSCLQILDYHARCPDCGELVRMDEDHFVIPDEATTENIELFEIFYACNSCGVQWNEHKRKMAYLSGAWVCIKGADLSRPETVGFHFPAFPCPNVPMVEIATAKLKAKTGDLSDKSDFAHGYKVIDYEPEIKDRDEDLILQLVNESMPRKVCPRNPSRLIVMADTQQVGFHYEVWAFGWGEDLDVNVIDHGYVQEFSHLEQIRAREYRDADDKKYRAFAGFIDSGGGTDPYKPKHSRTKQVYEFCRKNRFWRPIKGKRDQAQPWSTTRLSYYPDKTGKKIPIPGGLILYTINVTLYKDDLSMKLQIQQGDPGAIVYHAEVGKDIAMQMCAEYKEEGRGWWFCPRHKENHHWDIHVYGMAGADILRIRDLKEPSPEGGSTFKRSSTKGVTLE